MTEKELMILECAKSQGFKIPSRAKVQKSIFEEGKLPYQVKVWEKVTPDDVKIFRGVTAPFAGSKDLGEWWIQCKGLLGIWIVKDDELKQFIRDYKIKKVLKGNSWNFFGFGKK